MGSENELRAEGAKHIAEATKHCESLATIIFGDGQSAATLSVNMADADISGKRIGAGGAIIAAEFMKRMTSLTSLNIASNGLGGPTWNRDLTGVQALAAVIPQMTSLTSLDISSNELDDGTKAQIKLAAASGGVGVVL